MLIRILLLLGLGATGWLVFLRRNRLPFHIVTVLVPLGVGGIAVVFPESANDIAHFAGVGRGADLITYIAIVGVMFVLNLLGGPKPVSCAPPSAPPSAQRAHSQGSRTLARGRPARQGPERAGADSGRRG